MTNLIDLFHARDDAFDDYSQKIFDSITNVIDGCNRFVAKRGITPQMLKWEGISLIKDDHIVLLFGTVSYHPGDHLVLPDGEELEITDEAPGHFTAMVRFGIPYDLVVDGTDDEIYSFLNDTIEERLEVSAELLDGLRPHSKRTIDIEPQAVDDFDLDGLTEEQKENMKLFLASEMMKENGNN